LEQRNAKQRNKKNAGIEWVCNSKIEERKKHRKLLERGVRNTGIHNVGNTRHGYMKINKESLLMLNDKSVSCTFCP
jgi:hypothetical protein